MKVLHIKTQDDQSIGSLGKCCEKCGMAYWTWDSTDKFVSSWEDFTQELAEKSGLTLCDGGRKEGE